MQNNHDISISFEVFPPNTPLGLQKLQETCNKLKVVNPNFISVTFGAAGASQLKTLRLIKNLTKQNIPTTPHISCVGMTKIRLQKILEDYIQWGVNNLIVIRGDFVPGSGVSDFIYASDLVSYIRKLTGDHFHLTVAAYPEFHPQSKTSETDFIHFQQKVNAGANSAITQFFFNSDAYCRFRDNCHKAGMTIPIIPGIMPIQDYAKLVRFSGACGAEIPLWLRKQLDSFSGDVFSIKSLGVELVTKLCEKLLLEGAEGLHFYTLNQLNPTLHIYRSLFSDRSRTDFLNFMYAS